MSIEPTCDFCGASDKNRCKTKKEADSCPFFTEMPTKVTNNENKPEVVLDDEFGFTFVEEADEIAEIDNSDEIAELQTRLDNLYNAVIPFLDNLCKNPEKKTISWPNRVEKINDYKKKLESIKEGKLK